MRLVLALAALALAAPAALAQQKIAAADLPPEVAAAVRAAAPGMTILEAELKEREGRRYYDVEGTMNGAEIELDLLQTDKGWQVVEVQRDIAWHEAPPPVRTAAHGPTKGVAPARIIESRQNDGTVIYELFAPGQPKDPAVEVAWKDGAAKVLTEKWPH